MYTAKPALVRLYRLSSGSKRLSSGSKRLSSGSKRLSSGSKRLDRRQVGALPADRSVRLGARQPGARRAVEPAGRGGERAGRGVEGVQAGVGEALAPYDGDR
ncbi:hypothetical protein GWI24_44120 [Streptomyces sp. MK37H]|nr:hypothetical protein [Streptomyces sp. MK37H]